MSALQSQPLSTYMEYSVEEMKARAASFRKATQRRRTVRQFSTRPVPREIIEECLIAAGTAPSGANRRPWQFVVISLLVTGYPAEDAQVPFIQKKPLTEIATFI